MNDHDRIYLKRAFDSAVIGGGISPAAVLHYVAELAVDADPAPCREVDGPARILYEVNERTGEISRTVFP